MTQVILTPSNKKALEIYEKIKSFTFRTPSNKGVADPSYKSYLAICARLFQLDCELHDLFYTYDDTDDAEAIEELEHRLLEIEQEVDELVK